MISRLKASYQDYFKHFKRIKLGVNKASCFLKDLELELKKLPLAKESELYFLNDETQTKIFIPQDQVYKVEFWLEKLMLKYYVEHSEMLYLEEYNPFHEILKNLVVDYVEKQGISFDLNEVLELKTKEKAEKINILFKLLVLAFNESNYKINSKIMLNKLGNKIFEYCILNELEIDKNHRAKYLQELKTTKNTTELYNRYFHLRTENPKIINYINAEFLKEKKNKIFLVENFIEFLVFKVETELNKKNSKSFWFVIKRCIFGEEDSRDYLLDLKWFKLSKGKKKIKVNKELFYIYLIDLDNCRVKRDLNFLYLNDIYSLMLRFYANMCNQKLADESLIKVQYYVCDFLGKKKLNGYKDEIHKKLLSNCVSQILINRYFDTFYYYRIVFHEKLFRTLVMSSFFIYCFRQKKIFLKKING